MSSACFWHALLTPFEIPALSVWFLPRVRKGFNKAFKMGPKSLDPLHTGGTPDLPRVLEEGTWVGVGGLSEPKEEPP